MKNKTIKLIDIYPGCDLTLDQKLSLDSHPDKELTATVYNDCIVFDWDCSYYNKENIDNYNIRQKQIGELLCGIIAKLVGIEEKAMSPFMDFIYNNNEQVYVFSMKNGFAGIRPVESFPNDFKVTKWKVIKQGLNIEQAMNVVKGRYTVLGLPISAYNEFASKKLITQQSDERQTYAFTIGDLTSQNWELVIPDIEKNNAINNVRELIKNSQVCNVVPGISNRKLNYLNAEEMWEIINNYVLRMPENKILSAIELIVNNIKKK